MPKSAIAVGGHPCVWVKRERERANGGERRREGARTRARASERRWHTQLGAQVHRVRRGLWGSETKEGEGAGGSGEVVTLPDLVSRHVRAADLARKERSPVDRHRSSPRTAVAQILKSQCPSIFTIYSQYSRTCENFCYLAHVQQWRIFPVVPRHAHILSLQVHL
jgi:hypothetical protein